ncbi:substrate-binding periplasmic protein [Psychromonas aquimarina]|uniref:substrate-binding periplasmic protein n=1 Tax=Psychromonas aquimarina TaxID=444919 RepID=UPI000687D528|nr:transporter substrate-binding domain-containing protein [Psychromonas aquimarina]
MAEDYPPANYIENGEIKGASVDILKLVWKKLGVPEQPIKIVPWARGYLLVQKKKNTVLFSMSRTKEREHLFKWVGPIFRSRQVIVGLTDSPIKIDSLEDAEKYTIGTIRDDVCENTLISAGFDRKKLHSVTSLEQNISKLLLKRVDLICHSEASIRDVIKMKNQNAPQFKTIFVVTEKGNYYAFHKDSQNDLIRSFQLALDELEPERREILKRSNMTP